MPIERVGMNEAAVGLRELSKKTRSAKGPTALRTATVSVLGYGEEEVGLNTRLRAPCLPRPLITDLGNVVGSMSSEEAQEFLHRLAALLQHLDHRTDKSLFEVDDVLEYARLNVALAHLKTCAAFDPWLPRYLEHVEAVAETWPLQGGLDGFRKNKDISVLLRALEMYGSNMKSVGDPLGRINATAAGTILIGAWNKYIAAMALRESLLRVRDPSGMFFRRVKTSEFEIDKAHLNRRFTVAAGQTFLAKAERYFA